MQNRTKKIIYIILLIIEALLLIAGYAVPNWWCVDDQNGSAWDGAEEGNPITPKMEKSNASDSEQISVSGVKPFVVVIHKND